jgi:hypothetical protein
VLLPITRDAHGPRPAGYSGVSHHPCQACAVAACSSASALSWVLIPEGERVAHTYVVGGMSPSREGTQVPAHADESLYQSQIAVVGS